MEFLCKRAEKALKKIIRLENKLKNKKILNFKLKNLIKKRATGNIKNLPFPYEQAFAADIGNPCANKNKDIKVLFKKIKKMTVFDIYKKANEFEQSKIKHLKTKEEKDIESIKYRTNWKAWFESHKFKGLKLRSALKVTSGYHWDNKEGGHNFVKREYPRDLFALSYKLPADIITELSLCKLTMPLNSNTSDVFDSTNYSHIIFETQEINDEEPKTTYLCIKPSVINYFKEKSVKNRVPIISTIISIISIITAITSIILKFTC